MHTGDERETVSSGGGCGTGEEDDPTEGEHGPAHGLCGRWPLRFGQEYALESPQGSHDQVS